jgi:hypothetical protein
MMSPEALPIAGGAIFGCLARYAYYNRRWWSYVAGVFVIALCATIASGEFRQSWGFLIDDVLIVTVSACGAFVLSGLVVRRRLFDRK